LGNFFAALQTNIWKQSQPHDPKDLIRAMESACGVEEAMKDSW